MKFLIIGASGFIGRNIFNYLNANNYEVYGTKNASRNDSFIKFDLLHDKIENCIPNFLIDSKEQVYAVICSYISQIDRCLLEKEVSYIVNVEKMISLINDLESLNFRIIFLSTSAVFDGYDGYYTEEAPRNPICEYGKHKVLVEKFLEKKESEHILNMRIDKIVGDRHYENHLFAQWYDSIKQNKAILCIKNQILSPTYVNDIARAIEISSALKLSGTFHVANSEYFTREELANHFLKAINNKTKIISLPLNEFNFADLRPLKTYLDSSKFIENTNFSFTSMRKVYLSFINKVK